MDEKRHWKSQSLVVPNTPFSTNRRVKEPISDFPDNDKVELGCDCQQPSDTSNCPELTESRTAGKRRTAENVAPGRLKQIA